jgi:cytochrome P450
MHEYWPEPERFDPERFAGHRREDRVHRFAWSPFGGGVHKCIGLHFAGLQVKAVLHQLLRRFRWSTAPGYQAPMDYTALPYPKDGLPVRLSPR